MCDRFTFAINKWTIEKYFGAKFYIAEQRCNWSPTLMPRPRRCGPSAAPKMQAASSSRWGLWPENGNAMRTTADQRPPHGRDREADVLDLIP
jgi:hypothetical protein